MYSTALADWGLLLVLQSGLGESYPSAEMQSVYSTAPADWASLLFIPCGLGESYPSEEMRSVYFHTLFG